MEKGFLGQALYLHSWWMDSLNYSLAARLQDNSRSKSPTKVETKRKLQQFSVSGWLIMNGAESGSENIKRKV